MVKRQLQEERLLEVPERLAEAQNSVDLLATRLEESAVVIADLKRQLSNANSIKSKVTDYVVGGVVGAFLGALASMIIK
jgi:hypothetical protein